MKILLFPGVVFHELAHYVMCKILGVEVKKVSISLDSGFVRHVVPRSIIVSLLIAVAPGVLAAAFSLFALSFSLSNIYYEIVKHYLVFAVLYESFPSKADTNFTANHSLLKKIIFFPLFAVFRLFYFFSRNKYLKAIFSLLVMNLSYYAIIWASLL